MHICYSMAKLLGYTVNSAIPTLPNGNGSDEHMVNPMVAQILFLLDGYIFHQHVKATEGNINQLRGYHLKPLVTVRNIFDILVSAKERMDGRIHAPCVVSPVDWNRLSEYRKWHWLAYNLTNWNIAFVYSWLTTDIDKLFVSYEHFYDDQASGMAEILEFLGLPVPLDLSILGQRGASFNVGRIGRGEAVPKYARNIVLNQIDVWDDKRIGELIL